MTSAGRLRILRIRRPASLITAQAYEDLFDRQFPTRFDVSFAPLEPWCDELFGSPDAPVDLDAAAARFAAAAAPYDFFCPSYECIPLAPLLLALRNRTRSSARLLFVAHAPGSYTFEWALLRPLLAPGDVIMAPSESARATIVHLCPELAPFTWAIPHPMAPLPATARAPGGPLVASLGRIHAQKLTHRLIDAVALLRRRGARSLRLAIGGSLDDGGWQGPHPYTRTLRKQVRRLGLDDAVTFPGAVRGDAAKSAFLCAADAIVNLSVTVEESFGKSPVEALGVGVPVVATDWDGLRETVGPCGRLAPVMPSGDVMGMVDVSAECIADAIEAVLDAPPPAEACRAWARRFAPESVLPRYQAVLESAADGAPRAFPDWPGETVPAAPAAGLLAAAPPLTAMTWRELFDAYLPWCGALRRAWASGAGMPMDRCAQLRNVLASGVEPSLKRHFANLPPVAPATAAARAVSAPPNDATDDPADAFERAARMGGLLAGRLACVRELVALRRPAAARAALDEVPDAEWTPALRAFWHCEVALAAGEPAVALGYARTAASAQPLGDADWPVLRQVARAARRAGVPGAALPLLLAWLDRYPDSQESGALWLDACVAALRAEDAGEAVMEDSVELAARCHARAEALLGDMPAVQKCGAMTARARAARTLVGA